MVVIVMENAPESLRGELTRWLLETKAGVFVGRLSAMVRDKLWEKICQRQDEGGALLIYSAPNDQGYVIRLNGNPRRTVIDLEGIQLIKIQQ